MGIILDNKLNWKQHINYTVCSKCKQISNKIVAVARLNWAFRDKNLQLIYNSIIQSSLSYGVDIWANNLKVKDINSLLSAQRIIVVKAANGCRTFYQRRLL